MTAKKPSKVRAEDLVATTLFNSEGYGVLHIDFDDLAKRFSCRVWGDHFNSSRALSRR
jgi:hypothetical protein